MKASAGRMNPTDRPERDSFAMTKEQAAHEYRLRQARALIAEFEAWLAEQQAAAQAEKSERDPQP